MTRPSHAETLAAPPRLAVKLAPRALAAAAVALGGGVFAWQLAAGHGALAWSAYLIGAFYAFGLGLFGALWVAILYLSRGTWSVTLRRIPEAMTTWLVPGSVLLLLTGLGAHDLYHWSDAQAVAADELLTHKAPFLNLDLFYGLSGAICLVWIALSGAMVRASRRQDESGRADLTQRNVARSAVFVVLFALGFSAISFLFLMSLEPHWFSTMFAVLTFTDLMQAGTAFVALVAAVLIRTGWGRGFVDENHLHSLTKMMFAVTGFWAYIYFCQFLLIWYANLPEETVYFIRRWENGWLVYLAILPFVKFVIPFVYLAPRDNKRRPRRVIAMALLVLAAQFLELFVMVSPAVGHGAEAAHGHLPLVELAVTAGFLGAFFLVFSWSLGRHPPIPLKDPYLRACLGHQE